MNVGKSNIMRCSSYGNVGQMHLRLNSEPLVEVDCFKYLGSQVAADGRVYTLSGRIGKVVASHAAVARSIPAEVALIYTMHEELRRYCP